LHPSAPPSGFCAHPLYEQAENAYFPRLAKTFPIHIFSDAAFARAGPEAWSVAL
jgi:hypothetical protein